MDLYACVFANSFLRKKTCFLKSCHIYHHWSDYHPQVYWLAESYCRVRKLENTAVDQCHPCSSTSQMWFQFSLPLSCWLFQFPLSPWNNSHHAVMSYWWTNREYSTFCCTKYYKHMHTHIHIHRHTHTLIRQMSDRSLIHMWARFM